MEEKVMIRLKRRFSNHLLMVRLNLSSDNVRNCEETTMLVIECEKNIKFKKEEILNLAYKQGFMSGKSKKSDKFKEMC